MALNLSTLTNASTSASILNEALTTADLLDPVPILKNLARGSNKGGDAKQTTALNQPKALPLIDGDGYLYLSGVAGNYASTDSIILPATGDFDLSIDFIVKGPISDRIEIFHQYDNGSGRLLLSVNSSNQLRVFWGPVGEKVGGVVVEGQKHTANLVRSGSSFTLSLDGTSISTWTSSDSISQVNSSIGLGGNSQPDKFFKGAIFSVTEGSNTNIDFTATNVRHGDTKFKCATGQVVTINQDSSSSNDVATIIKKSVLRFDGVNDGLRGVFANNINGGYMFAAFSVLGTGGESNGRAFTINQDANGDFQLGGAIFGYHPSAGTLRVYAGGAIAEHTGLFDDSNRDILHEAKITNGNQLSKVNNADLGTTSITYVVNSNKFNIAANESDSRSFGENTAIDLEYLALFPATITDAEADSVRSFINKRNSVFYRWDTDGYYFFDPQKATFTGNFTGSNTLDGYITGSDLGDTDVRTNLTLEQATLNDQPSTDGYTITFNDSAEHLDFENGASQNLSGWQVVGTSMGTFAYRVQGAVTTLNLLGNAGGFPTLGENYGIILLPASATGADIEQARSLLIDRGAADNVTGNLYASWYIRPDIVEFYHIDTSQSGTNIQQTWQFCNSLVSFPALDLSNGTSFAYAWEGCSSMQNFNATRMDAGGNFTSAWKDCTALTSFPAGAKLGTSANNVNFTSAWQSSGLTSFSTPLPSATNVSQGWYQCASLTSFSSDLSAATTANYAWLSCTSLTSFDTPLPSATQMLLAWYNCSSLTSFSSELPLAANANQAWLNCTSLTDFSVDVFANWNPSSITSGVFNLAWDGCVALTAQSVENILTSIDASNQHGTDDGTSTGNPLGDAGIDIDYNTVGGTSLLSAATNAAVTSLKSKGWSIIVNNVTL